MNRFRLKMCALLALIASLGLGYQGQGSLEAKPHQQAQVVQNNKQINNKVRNTSLPTIPPLSVSPGYKVNPPRLPGQQPSPSEIKQQATKLTHTYTTPSQTTVTVGPGGDYSTIQAAIDAFGSGNAGFTTIKIAPGIYEEALSLQGFSSGQENSGSVFIPNGPYVGLTLWQGLYILGDDRKFGPGKTYANGYENTGDSCWGGIYRDVDPSYPYLYYPPLGTNLAITKLYHPGGNRSQITVEMTNPLPVADWFFLGPYTDEALEQPKFGSPWVGVQVGDRFILADADIFGNYTTSMHTITSIVGGIGNTLTFTPPVPVNGVDITQPGANITFLPNVLVSAPYDPNQGSQNIMTINNVSLKMTGIGLNQHESQPYGSIANALGAVGSSLYLSNVVTSDLYETGTLAGTFFQNCNVMIANDNDTNTFFWHTQQYLTSVGWSTGHYILDSAVRGGHLAANKCEASMMFVALGSSVSLATYEAHGCRSGLSIGGCGNVIGLDELWGTGNEVFINQLGTITDVFGHALWLWGSNLYCNTPALRIERILIGEADRSAECDLAACYIDQASQFTIYKGFYNLLGRPTQPPRLETVFKDIYNKFPAPATVPNTPYSTIDGVGIFVETMGRFTTLGQLVFDNVDVPYFTHESGQFDAPYDAASPNNIFQHTSSGKINSVFLKQALLPNAKNMTFDPGEAYSGSAEVFKSYVGKEFFIYSTTDDTHTINFPPNVELIGDFNGHGSLKLCGKRGEKCSSGKCKCKDHVGSYLTLQAIDANTVLVTDSSNVKFVH